MVHLMQKKPIKNWLLKTQNIMHTIALVGQIMEENALHFLKKPLKDTVRIIQDREKIDRTVTVLIICFLTDLTPDYVQSHRQRQQDFFLENKHVEKNNKITKRVLWEIDNKVSSLEIKKKYQKEPRFKHFSFFIIAS